MIQNIFYSLIVLLVLGCSNKEEFILFNKADIKQSKDSSIENTKFDNIEFEYKIVPHDRVSILIYEHPEFSTSSMENRAQDRGILVNAKGDIHLPLVKSVHIAGLTQTEALEKVESAFSRYLKSPDIYLEVLNKRAYVIGEVKKPGEIELINEKLTLIQALAKAGDLTDSANRHSILILRSTMNGIRREIVDLTDVNSLTMANLMIKPNDIVYVVPNDIKAFNVNVNEINPMVRLIGNILSPFVSIKYLSK
ncbi:MAG: polysaccharide export protein [Sulfurovaceae bacterium]|nr:polysaccharide export protein [Sulfurovaceae bacterium]